MPDHSQAAPMIRFNCPNCGKRLKFPPEAVGKPAKCPKCGIDIAPQVGNPEPEEPQRTGGELVQVITMPPSPQYHPIPVLVPYPVPVAVPTPPAPSNPFELPGDDRPSRRFIRDHSNAIRNWHWLVGISVCGLLAFIGLWLHAEASVQQIERLRDEHPRLEAAHIRACLFHDADSPECSRARADLLDNENEQRRILSSPNFLVRWKVRDLK